MNEAKRPATRRREVTPPAERQSGAVPKRRGDLPAVVVLADGGIAVAGGTTLSRRQVEILECIAAGFTNDMIAEELVIGCETVKKHVGALLRCIAAPNRAALAAWWAEVAAAL